VLENIDEPWLSVRDKNSSMWGRDELTWRDGSAVPRDDVESREQVSLRNGASYAMPTPAFEPNNGIVTALLRFFGLQQQPFGVTPDPSFLYLSRTHREALASLVYGIESGRGFLALVAKPGMGKTTLLFHLLQKFRNSARTAFIFQTQCNSREFLQLLSSDLGFASSTNQDFARMHEEFNYHLLNEARNGKRFIIIVDEAQNLDASVLETIRLLSNFETPRAKLLQIVLSGQPQLKDKLASRGMIQLHQRVSLMNRLEPLSREETEQYIRHRLSVAGYTGSALLTSDALAIVTDFANGLPRKINNACFNALSLAFAMQRQVIDEEIAREAIGDLELLLHFNEADNIKENGVIADSDVSKERKASSTSEQSGDRDGPANSSQPTHVQNYGRISGSASSVDVARDSHAEEEEKEPSAPNSPQRGFTPSANDVISNSAPPADADRKRVAKDQFRTSASPEAKEVRVSLPDQLSTSADWTKANDQSLSVAEAKAYMNRFIRSLKNPNS
jgi:type II secretory pathway predicted ATPase ExeA